MGFSQGAILISALMAKSIKEDFCVKPGCAILFGNSPSSIRSASVFDLAARFSDLTPCSPGAAWPQPFDALLCSLEASGPEARVGQYAPRTLHVYSPQDRVNPPAMAERIQKVAAARMCACPALSRPRELAHVRRACSLHRAAARRR